MVSGSEPTPGGGEPSPFRRHGRAPRRRPWLRRLLVGGLVVVLLLTGAGVYGYRQLNGNIRNVPLYAGTSGDAGTEKPDLFGRRPINLLAIGSDSREKKANCKLGGGCVEGRGQNADVEMVV